jgi:PAS domain S-box-containing protein
MDEPDSSKPRDLFKRTAEVFEALFARSCDAFWLYDPLTAMLVDCNRAAVALIGAQSKERLLRTRPEQLSPELQPDGIRSDDKARTIIAYVEEHGAHRFEWMIRRFDGKEVPVEVTSTAVVMRGRSIHVVVSRDISERKQAEQKLRELTHALEERVAERTAALTASEARFRALVEHAPEAIVVFDGDSGRFLFGNQHACQLYGVPMETLATLAPTDVSPEFQPEGRRSSDLAREKIAEALAGGMPVFEWIHRQQPTGRLVPTEVRLLRLPAQGQNLIRASIIDNSERKQAERAIRESEAKFRALFEGSSHGVVLHDENQILEVNPAGVRIMGLEHASDLVGKHPRELAPKFQPNGELSEVVAQRQIEKTLNRGSARFEWTAADPGGHEIPLEVALTRIEWSGRQVIQAFITDITERKRAQAALAESEARFSVAFKASPVFTSILRMNDGKYVLCNDAFVNWMGCPREEILGRSSAELGIWENPSQCEVLFKELTTAGSLRHKECHWRNKRGQSFTILLSAELITLDNTPHVLCLDLDITERKQAEIELARSLARERELSELKSSFVSMVSHEFRTPLGIIQSSAELLRDFAHKMRLTERDEQLESISRNAARMAGMMEEVLVLSRLDAGKLSFSPAPLDFRKFCRRLVDEIVSATNRRCAIELSLQKIPSLARADEKLLAHIFTNLLSNAVKYSDAPNKVQFTVKRDGADAVCVIEDRGIGISEEDQEHLFKAFHRGSNVGARQGTGLGLLLVKRCAELHGGKVEIKSRIAEGTRVTARLPIF